MEGRLLAKARSALAEKQRRNHSEENRRRAEIYESIPEIRTIDGEILKALQRKEVTQDSLIEAVKANL